MLMRPGNAGYFDPVQKNRVLSETIRDRPVPISALVACVIGAIFVQLYAGVALRGVYADGAFFATQMLAHHGIVIMQPARLMSEMIYEWPVVLAMRLGVYTAHGVALIFSVVTNVLPGLIILLCLATIPSGRRCLFIFPAFVYFAGILSAQFASVTEGLVATSYFWLLFCLITLGRPTILRLTLITALSIASLHLHEEMVFLGPILIASCVFRWQHERRYLPRVVLCAAALSALTSALIGGNWVLHPISGSAEENAFVSSFLGLQWIYIPDSGFNLPCILGFLAALCILFTVLRPAWASVAIVAFVAASIPLALASFRMDFLIAPNTQFAARNNAALMSAPLAVLFLVAQRRQSLGIALNRSPARAIVILLGITVSVWHIGATNQWSEFFAHFSRVLQSRNGMIAWGDVTAQASPRQARLVSKMVCGWTNPDLSLIASPTRCVSSVIENPTWSYWQPYTLSNVATMPKLPGVTYTYLLPPDRQECQAPADAAQTALERR